MIHFQRMIVSLSSPICFFKNWLRTITIIISKYVLQITIEQRISNLGLVDYSKNVKKQEWNIDLAQHLVFTLIAFWGERTLKTVCSQGRQGKFEPDKVQYSTPFFYHLFLTRVYWNPKSTMLTLIQFDSSLKDSPEGPTACKLSFLCNKANMSYFNRNFLNLLLQKLVMHHHHF